MSLHWIVILICAKKIFRRTCATGPVRKLLRLRIIDQQFSCEVENTLCIKKARIKSFKMEQNYRIEERKNHLFEKVKISKKKMHWFEIFLKFSVSLVQPQYR